MRRLPQYVIPAHLIIRVFTLILTLSIHVALNKSSLLAQFCAHNRGKAINTCRHSFIVKHILSVDKSILYVISILFSLYTSPLINIIV